jgi:hypothetical protein
MTTKFGEVLFLSIACIYNQYTLKRTDGCRNSDEKADFVVKKALNTYKVFHYRVMAEINFANNFLSRGIEKPSGLDDRLREDIEELKASLKKT